MTTIILNPKKTMLNLAVWLNKWHFGIKNELNTKLNLNLALQRKISIPYSINKDDTINTIALLILNLKYKKP